MRRRKLFGAAGAARGARRAARGLPEIGIASQRARWTGSDVCGYAPRGNARSRASGVNARDALHLGCAAKCAGEV